MRLAKSEAKILHDKISDKAYDHEDVIRILSTRSKPQLIATLNQFNDEFGNAFNKVNICIPQKSCCGGPLDLVNFMCQITTKDWQVHQSFGLYHTIILAPYRELGVLDISSFGVELFQSYLDEAQKKPI